jgi:hypothetical protein
VIAALVAVALLDCSEAPALRSSGFCAPADSAVREKLPTPGVQWKMNDATATRAPWVDANGWRFERHPGRRYRYVLPAGTAALAAAEVFAYGVDAVLQIDPQDLAEYAAMRRFLERVQAPAERSRANIAVVDDGSEVAGEAMNLLARRNLLFHAVKAPAPGYDLTVRITPVAANPSAFAAKVRRDLGDDKRLVRIFGSEVVLGRLTVSRLHLINYSRQKIEGLRVRVLGSYRKAALAAFGYDKARLEDLAVAGGATEFSISEMDVYAVVNLAFPTAQ